MKYVKRLSVKRFILLFVVFVVIGSCSKEEPETVSEDRTDFSDASGSLDVVLDKLGGGHARLSEFRGKPVLLNFFATWDNESVEFVQIMNTLQKRYKLLISVIGVVMDKNSASAIRGFMRKQPVDFQVFINGEKISKRFGRTSRLPRTYIILSDGRVFECVEGLHVKKYYVDKIKDILTSRL